MAKKTVLVLDDEEGIREVLEEFFTDEGYAVSVAADGLAALEIFAAGEFGLVITDIAMPGIDGIETLRRMKKQKPETKVIVMSGLPDEETFERAIAVAEGSVEGFLPKPFKPRDLRDILAQLASGQSLPSFGLTENQIESLNAVGKAGAEEASSALAKLTGKNMDIIASEVRVISLPKVVPAATRKDNCAGILLRCKGSVSGTMAVTLSWNDGMKLIDLLAHQEVGTTKAYDAGAYPILQAAGSVLAISYMNAVEKLLGLKGAVSISGLSFESEASVLKDASSEAGLEGGHVFVISTLMEVPAVGMKLKVSLLPDTESLKGIFRSSGTFAMDLPGTKL